jgi:hypothetical protein
MSPYGDEPSSEADLATMIEGGEESGTLGMGDRRGSGAGTRAGTRAGGIYQDLFDRIGEYQELASVPSASELTRYKLDEDRAKSLGGRRAGIEALMPTDKQYRQRIRGKEFSKLSEVLARTGDPSKRQDFGQIGEAISGETDRQLAERLGFEEKLAGIDTDIYGVEGQGLDRRVLRERAGDPFRAVELGAMQSAAEAKASRQNALMVAALTQQGQNNFYRPANIPSIMAWLNSPSNRDQITAATRRIVMDNLSQVLTNMSSEEIDELSERFEEAQGAE